jgi:hypothetical protein
LVLCGSIKLPVVVVALAVLARTIIAAEQASEPVRNRLSRGMRQYSNLVHGWLITGRISASYRIRIKPVRA